MKGADPFLNTRIKIEDVNVLLIKGHSRKSKALLKSRDTRMPGMLYDLVYSMMSIMIRIFSPI